MGNSYFQTRRWFRSLKLQTHIYTAKKIERHIVNECLAYFNKFDLICAEQFGKKSCHTALSKLASSLLRVIDNGNITGLVYEDFKKAFDLVAHDILVRKLECYNFDEFSLRWFKSFGPLLFILFVNNLSLHISSDSIMFADDFTVKESG